MEVMFASGNNSMNKVLELNEFKAAVLYTKIRK